MKRKAAKQKASLRMESGDCVVCGENVYDDPNVIESYTLSHTYLVKDNDGLAAVAAPGTGSELIFCSAKCLVAYVNGKIAPDGAGEI